MTPSLEGNVLALLCTGTGFDRTLAVTAAEAGADVAIGTVVPANEFQVASIANEVWSLGRRQFVHPCEAADPLAMAAFAARVMDELGACDIAVASTWLHSVSPFDELSADEWRPVIEANLTIPYLFIGAFGKVMAARSGGHIAIVGQSRPEADAAERAAKAGLDSLAGDANAALEGRGVTVAVAAPEVEAVLDLV